MSKNIYPDHIYEPVRHQIAAELVAKECLKLFPSTEPEDRVNMAKDIAGWWDGQGHQLAPVHDFWNAFNGIMSGFKLKHTVRFLTAKNAYWQRKQVKVANIKVAWRLPSLEQLGNPPYTYEQITTWLKNNPQQLAKQRKIAEQYSTDFQPRDHYPVLLLRQNSELTVIDGNRRTLQAILHNKQTIDAWVGDLGLDVNPVNYWVSTAMLRDLLRIAEAAEYEGDIEVVDTVRSLLAHLCKVSEIAKINWDLRCRDQSDLAESITPKD